jgi:hypothetical protein
LVSVAFPVIKSVYRFSKEFINITMIKRQSQHQVVGIGYVKKRRLNLGILFQQGIGKTAVLTCRAPKTVSQL